MRVKQVNHELGRVYQDDNGEWHHRNPLTIMQALELTADKSPLWFVDKGDGYGPVLMYFGPGERKFDFAIFALIDGELQRGTALTRENLLELYHDIGDALMMTQEQDDQRT